MTVIGRPWNRRVQRLRKRAVALAAACATTFATAQLAPESSALDAPLFYQLLVGELELRAGEAGTAFEVMMDAARRTRDESLFRRAMEIALQARAGDQALMATKAWRGALPTSIEAVRYDLQLMLALNRMADAAEPMAALLAQSPAAERPGLILSLPRLFQRQGDRREAAALVDKVLQPYSAAGEERTASLVTQGRMWLAASEAARALDLAQQARRDDPQSTAPVLLALELMPSQPAAESLVSAYLNQPGAQTPVRLAYVRALTTAQRYPDAVTQLEMVTRSDPELAPPWLSLGALRLELREPALAEQALERYVALAQAPAPAQAPEPASPPPQGQAQAVDPEGQAAMQAAEQADNEERGLTQAWLLLAQAAEQRADFPAAERWLARIENPQRMLDVQSRRAVLMARQGQVAEARELVRAVPERSVDDARAKVLAETHMLREVKLWGDAYELLGSANERFSDDTDLLYEQAMAAEKLDRLADMERLLRRVIEIQPEHHHAHNALGYSLADRNLRLSEARDLIRTALELAPGDPFITDSLGWVEYRMGNRAEALRLLRQAYATRPDTEIAAHLGEVLWVEGQHDEARRVWRDARQRDAANQVLIDTLARLKVDL